MTPPGEVTDGVRLLGAIESLDGRVRQLQENMSARFDALSDRFMPRVEQLQRFDNLIQTSVGLRQRIDTQDRRIEEVEDRREADRKFAITTLLAILGIAMVILALIIQHWK